MRWVVDGADVKTGEDRRVEVEGQNRAAAERAARSLGMLVADVAPAPVAAHPIDYQPPAPASRSTRAAVWIIIAATALGAAAAGLVAVRTTIRRGVALTTPPPSPVMSPSLWLSFDSIAPANVVLNRLRFEEVAASANMEKNPALAKCDAVAARVAGMTAPAAATAWDGMLFAKRADAAAALRSLDLVPDVVGIVADKGDEVQFLGHGGKSVMLLDGVALGTEYNTLRSTARERAARVVSGTGLPALGRIAQSVSAPAADSYAVGAFYIARDFGEERRRFRLDCEAVVIIAPAALCHDFAANRITDQQLLDGSEVYLYSDDTGGQLRRASIQLR